MKMEGGRESDCGVLSRGVQSSKFKVGELLSERLFEFLVFDLQLNSVNDLTLNFKLLTVRLPPQNLSISLYRVSLSTGVLFTCLISVTISSVVMAGFCSSDPAIE